MIWIRTQWPSSRFGWNNQPAHRPSCAHLSCAPHIRQPLRTRPATSYTHGYSVATLGRVNLRIFPISFFVSAFLCLVVGSPLAGQEFRIGFMGGSPVTSSYVQSTSVYPGDPVNPPNIFTTESGPRGVIAGVSLEALISSQLSVEADVLHRNLWAKWITTLNPGSLEASTTSNQFVASTTWEFPVLVKYTMPGNRWRPFVDGGVSFRSLERTSAPGPSRVGVTGGAGFAMAFGRIQLTPQLRYTRWARAESNGFYDVKRDQLEFLTGISYRLPTAVSLGSRRIALGVLGGARLNETLTGVPNRLNRRAFAGLSLDMNVRAGFSIEAGGIYKPIGISKNSVLTWEFPVLLKYRWNVRAMRPFAEAGPSFRASGNLQSSVPPSSFGFTAGAGIEKQAGRIRIAPALRYTRWGESQGYTGYPARHPYKPDSIDLIVAAFF